MAARVELELQLESLIKKLDDYNELSVAEQKYKDEAEVKFKNKEEEIWKLRKAKDLKFLILKNSIKYLQSEKEELKIVKQELTF